MYLFLRNIDVYKGELPEGGVSEGRSYIELTLK
jgi:hypothetical protein